MPRQSLDYETQSSYSIRVKTTDGDSNSYEEALSLTVRDLNDPPTDIALSSNGFDENLSIDEAVTTLSSVDQDAGDIHTYELVQGDGDTDNEHAC